MAESSSVGDGFRSHVADFNNIVGLDTILKRIERQGDPDPSSTRRLRVEILNQGFGLATRVLPESLEYLSAGIARVEESADTVLHFLREAEFEPFAADEVALLTRYGMVFEESIRLGRSSITSLRHINRRDLSEQQLLAVVDRIEVDFERKVSLLLRRAEQVLATPRVEDAFDYDIHEANSPSEASKRSTSLRQLLGYAIGGVINGVAGLSMTIPIWPAGTMGLVLSWPVFGAVSGVAYAQATKRIPSFRRLVGGG